MNVNPEELQVVHLPEQSRFEIRVENLISELIYDLRGDKIVRERRIYDFTGMLVQIGVLKARPA